MATAARANASATAIEVERKFAADVSVEEMRARVERLGGREKGSITFFDTYYDTPSCQLASRDVWLRRRDRQWELKVPVDGDEARSGGERSVFREVEGTASVTLELASILEKVEDAKTVAAAEAVVAAAEKEEEEDEDEALARLEALLLASSAFPFAEFGTSRVKFELDGASIDVDAASFGYTVVEVEVMCVDASQVATAESTVGEVAAKLGLRPLVESGGKLETYIRQKCPNHLNVLVAKGYLKP